MTKVYASYDNKVLFPISYGLVVVDMVNNEILSLQGYTAIGALFVTDPSAFRPGQRLTDDEFNEARFLAFDKMGRTAIDPEVPPNYPPHQLRYYAVDMSPFKVTNFEESAEGMRALKEAVIRLGFKLSPEEEQGWTDSIREQDELENPRENPD
jgi:hypothetical protein